MQEKRSKSIRILYIQSRIVIGGPSSQNLLLTKILNDDEFETILVGGACSKDEKSLLHEADKSGLSYQVIDEMGREIHFYDDLVSLIKLYRLIRNLQPQIVHTHTAKAGAIGRIAAFLAGVPYLFHTFHGHIFEGYFGKIKSRIFIYFERLLALITTRIITISEQQRQDILFKFKIAGADKVEMIPLGFEWTNFLNTKLPYSLRQNFAIDNNKFLIGIIGRIVPIKNHWLFLEIAFRLIETVPKAFHFIIIGDGELRPKLETKIAQRNLMDYFTFTSWLELNAQIYRELDLVLLTSKNEGTPVALIEALVAGIPIVSSAVGGVPDIFKFYRSEYLIASAKVEDFVEKIMAIYKVKYKVDQDISNKVKEYFNSDRLCRDIRSLYKRTVYESI